MAPQSATKDVINADNPLVTYKHTARTRIAQWIQIRHQEPGIKNIEVAKRMGITLPYLNSLISQATKEGWLKFDDPLSRIEYEIVPKTLDNMSLFLDQKDRQATLEAFKHTVAAQYKESKGISEGQKTVIALKIEASPDGEPVKVLTGNIVGKPKDIFDVTAEEE